MATAKNEILPASTLVAGNINPLPFAELAKLPIWICWRLEPPTEAGRPKRKVPYWANGRRKGWSKSAGWGTRARAKTGLKRLLKDGQEGGLGIVLGPIACSQPGSRLATCRACQGHGRVREQQGFFTIERTCQVCKGSGRTNADRRSILAGLDLDTCIDQSGKITPWAQTELDALDSYAEISPSKTGVKAYFLVQSAKMPVLLKALGNSPDAKTLTVGHKWSHGTGHHPPAIELYLGARWFAVTGDRLPDSPATLATVPAKVLLELIEDRGPAFAVGSSPGTGKRKKITGRSERAMGLAARMKQNGATQAEFEEAIDDDPELSAWRDDHDQRQVDRAWKRASSGDGLADLEGFGLNEDGVAQAFTARHRAQLRFDHTSGKWHVWDDTRWKREETRLAFDWSRTICRDLRVLNAADSAARALATRTAEAVEKFAQADRAFAVTAETWDRDPWLLGTPAGTVG